MKTVKKKKYNSLNDMSRDSAPGKDGLPMEFCWIFWYLIKEDFTELVHYIFFEKTMSFQNNESSNYFVNPENNTRGN